MDFLKIYTRKLKKQNKDGTSNIEITFDLLLDKMKDLMIRGKSFYAIWNEEENIWSTNESDIQKLIDKELYAYANKLIEKDPLNTYTVSTVSNFSSRKWMEVKSFIQNAPNNYKDLDIKIAYKDVVYKREDYISKRLVYNLSNDEPRAYNELMNCLYDSDEKEKLEWALGAAFSGDVEKIQKFIVLYGSGGTGKSTFLKIIEMLFEGYTILFDAKSLGSSSNQFSTEPFHNNGLIAIQHDGDLSRIEDNSKLNAIVSHEKMLVNEKYKAAYTITPRCFIFMATNKPVKITDAKSGLIRRLIDVKPTGNKIPVKQYDELMNQITFELGGIANQCINTYKKLGKNYYNSYRAIDMIYKTDVFFNFVEENSEEFIRDNMVTLSRAFDMFKQYCNDASVDYKIPKHKFREELKNYFLEFKEKHWTGEKQIRSLYVGFINDKFIRNIDTKDESIKQTLEFKPMGTNSIFDQECKDCLAQLASSSGRPEKKWVDVETTLKDIDTSKVHYIRLDINHIVIDFDLKDEQGNKSLKMNLDEASKWPRTYAEVSKSGSGIHLHYLYDGDVLELSSLYNESIEIKVFGGLSALRRKLTLCNNEPIAHISGGLPLKESKKGNNMVNDKVLKSEKALRELIIRNLKKEIHPGTKPSIDFIYKILNDVYNSGMNYDVVDLKQDVLAFAMRSTNQSRYCMDLVNKMKFQSKEEGLPAVQEVDDESDLVFYDTETFPNLFIVVFKMAGEGKEPVKLINPGPKEIEKMFQYKLVGFNSKKYDSHMLYGAYLGYDNQQLYKLSQDIIVNKKGLFREAYNLGYTDVYCFSSKKQSLKKWEIELEIPHKETPYKWDKPVPKDKWTEVVDYCVNDVLATEAVFYHLKDDYLGRKILADLAGGSVGDTTNQLTTKLIFEGEEPDLVYTDFTTGQQYGRGEFYVAPFN